MTNTGTIYDIVSALFLRLDTLAEPSWRLILLLTFLGNFYLLKKEKNKERVPEGLFLAFNVFCFIALRLPSFAANELNADEGEWIAGAATLGTDPRFWLSVDGTTSGPLNIFPLTIFSNLGFVLSFASARFFKVIFLDIPVVLCTFFCVKRLADKFSAMLAVFSLVVFLGGVVQKDIYAYGSENVPVCLIGIELLLLSVQLSKPVPGLNLLSGFIIGILPFSKLQSAYIALLLALGQLSILFFHDKGDSKKKAMRFLYFCIGGLAPLVFLFIYLKTNDLTDDFLQSYIFNNISYTAKLSLLQTFIIPILLFKKVKGLFLLLTLSFSLIGFGFVYFFNKLGTLPTKEKATAAFLLMYLTVSWYSIGKPGREFEHYLNFIFLPLVLCFAYFHFLIVKYSQKNNLVARSVAISVLSLLVGQFVFQQYNGNKILMDLVRKGTVKSNPVCSEIKKYRRDETDRLVVWGWQITDTGWGSHNKYYLETDLVQGTRESHSERQQTTFEKNNTKAAQQFEYYRNRYLNDLKRNRPVFFLDLDSSSATLFPALGRYIASNYARVNEWPQFHHDTIPIKSLLYVRNDRIDHFK